MGTSEKHPRGIRKFSTEEIARMRREMLEQYAPATEMPEQTRPINPGRLVRYDDYGD